MRSLFAAIIVVSTLTAFTVTNVYYQKKQFYPTVVFLTKHKPYFALIVLQCFALLLVIAKITAWVFFGDIRRTEIDNVFSRLMYTSFDMCLLFTFFQEDIGPKFLFLFSVIIFMKGFHWLLEGRVDLMERTPAIRASFHVRTISFMALLVLIDIFHISHFYWGVSTQNVASLAVGAEYYILFFELISTMMRYGLQVFDSMRNTPWDQKSLYLLYVDVFVGMLRVFFYLEFAPILWKHHPFPLFIIRPIYLNLRFLKKTIRNLVMSRRAIRLMNSVFHDVSATDMAASSDAVCIICREEMMPQSDTLTTIAPGTIKRLPCGHIFHATCLRNWFQRQQTCPTCRLNILRRPGNSDQANRPQRRGARPSQGQQSQQQQQDQVQNRRGASTAQIRIDIQHMSGGNTVETNVQALPSGTTGPFTYFPPNIQFSGVAQTNQSGNGVPSMFSTPPIIIPGDQFLPGVTAPMPEAPVDLAQSATTERELRASVEARIATLQRIQLLLDASIVQMNSYLAATTQAPLIPPHDTQKDHPLRSDAVSNGGSQGIEKGTLNSDAKLTNSEDVKPDPRAAEASDELSVLRQRRLEKLSSSNKERSEP
ncbi:E3 ubiquitin protein ligase synoviolin B [Echinococcus multilocularis]|uniref:RING-type E3 ubiquitin transferase n=1 Tax=Echinococcus multilocularis TaxID=6211 RepID=A0A068Y0P6_ECHMU|nr:E3 ubiquitin protein ligase synoviolin B [Echinococcus multilocularis]